MNSQQSTVNSGQSGGWTAQPRTSDIRPPTSGAIAPTVHRSLFTVHSPRPGFTLLELLAVILIMAILLGIMTHAAQLVIGIAREKRLAITCRTLESALARYRDEYGTWPIPRSPNTPSGDYDSTYGTTNQYMFSVSGDDNKHWFHLLRATDENAAATSGFNRKKIRFVDETTIFTVIDQKRTPLHKARRDAPDAKYPFVGVNKKGETIYFSIEIDVDADTVQVKSPQ